MKLILKLSLLFIITQSLNATLVSTAFVHNDLKVLEELDISSNYITNYQLQKEFQNRLKYSKKRYAQKLNNAHLFVPQIKKVLRDNNIPSAFLYLVMAESNFILDASSSKKAKGLWQFMEATANHYGLETDEFLDERMDIVKSTQAAVTYLKKLHSMFGKWYLAAVAYNCGEGRVIEAITRATIDMYCEDVGYKVCRKESRINEYRRTIRLYQAKKVKFREVNKIYKKVKKWKYKPDIDELLIVQKAVKRQYLPEESRGYIRKIIALAMMNNSDFLIKDENTHLLNRGISDPIAHIDVKGGVLLRNVAELIGLKKNKLKSLNQHIKKDILPLEHDTYRLYIPYSKLSRYNANKENLKSTQYENYLVKKGDTLASIGREFGLSYKIIKKHNGLKSNMLSIKQQLFIPINPDVYKRPVDYVVKVGDTIAAIANRYKVSFKKIMKDNNLKTSMIHIGDKLVIKFK
ncbi:MAG: LysM peptidoglycan-binding domain-containing protein [Campylobacterota bacterium]|nr:LysM peptidoglycan-binding domain-containing protein [Campylobacterota bacterium]